MIRSGQPENMRYYFLMPPLHIQIKSEHDLSQFLTSETETFISSKMELCDTAPFHPKEIK